MSALHHMASPSVLWREKPGQHQWLVLHSMSLHLLLCVVRNQQRGDSNENRTLGVHPASELVWDRKVCGFSFWFWFSVLFRFVLSRRQKFNWLRLVLLRNQELEFGKSPRRKPMEWFTSRLASSWWRLFATGTRKESVRSSLQLDKCFLVERRLNLSDPWMHFSNPCQLVRWVTQV